MYKRVNEDFENIHNVKKPFVLRLPDFLGDTSTHEGTQKVENRIPNSTFNRESYSASLITVNYDESQLCVVDSLGMVVFPLQNLFYHQIEDTSDARLEFEKLEWTMKNTNIKSIDGNRQNYGTSSYDYCESSLLDERQTLIEYLEMKIVSMNEKTIERQPNLQNQVLEKQRI